MQCTFGNAEHCRVLVCTPAITFRSTVVWPQRCYFRRCEMRQNGVCDSCRCSFIYCGPRAPTTRRCDLRSGSAFRTLPAAQVRPIHLIGLLHCTTDALGRQNVLNLLLTRGHGATVASPRHAVRNRNVALCVLRIERRNGFAASQKTFKYICCMYCLYQEALQRFDVKCLPRRSEAGAMRSARITGSTGFMLCVRTRLPQPLAAQPFRHVGIMVHMKILHDG